MKKPLWETGMSLVDVKVGGGLLLLTCPRVTPQTEGATGAHDWQAGLGSPLTSPCEGCKRFKSRAWAFSQN